jgi:hypothetical protein
VKITLVLCTTLTMLLGACGASPQSQQALVVQQQGCAAGNPDACVAASNQAQANQAEAANNNAIAASLGAAVLSGAAAGAVAGVTAPQPIYVNQYRPPHRWVGY